MHAQERLPLQYVEKGSKLVVYCWFLLHTSMVLEQTYVFCYFKDAIPCCFTTLYIDLAAFYIMKGQPRGTVEASFDLPSCPQ